MHFPEDINKSVVFRSLNGKKGKFVAYFHESDTVKNVFLNVNELFFLHVSKGIAKFQSRKGIFVIEAGQSAIVGKSSYIMSESLSGSCNCFNALLFFFEKEALEQYYFENPPENNEAEPQKRSILPIEKNSHLEMIAQSVFLLFDQDHEAYLIEDLINLKSKELLHYLSISNMSQEIHHILYPKINNEEYRLKEIIENNLFGSISIKELAFLSNMSLSKFKRKFFSIYGSSPGKWIKERKLEHSLKLLKTKNFTVNEAALKCGFRSATTFSKLFHKRYGIPPSSYL